MSKTAVPSRIPKFGSRIPQINSKQQQIQENERNQEITSKHIGQKVRFGDKEGILRFVGAVHFTCGIWCGIEFVEPIGKNDGFVNGVRYFACPPKRGLMAPLNKVELINICQENDSNDDLSGPYSMLFTEQQLTANQTYNIEENSSDCAINCDNNQFIFEENTIIPTEATFITDKQLPNCVDDLPIDIKRRRTLILDIKSSSQIRSFIENVNNKTCYHSTPLRTTELNNFDEDNSKRDSLEYEESSLGILTPDQMIDCMSFASTSHSRSSLEYVKQSINDKNKKLDSPKDELISPNPSCTTDYSFGIIDDHILANITIKPDVAMNMELQLDDTKNYTLTRLDLTPSPEELPLDPTPVVVDVTTKNKKTVNNSFITSITSITSLDTGYQGDGEMSRPASREADNSPLTRRPLIQRNQQICRRPDPMTDSDFYTESEADNHEENILKGDRRAQVIDGTLYGVDPQAAADIYVNNRENMDSSGIFTDLDTRTDEHEHLDVSPSDVSSSKTISDNSQNDLNDNSTITNTPTPTNNYISGSKKSLDKTPMKETSSSVCCTKKRNASSPVNSSSPSSILSPRHLNSSVVKNDAKKYKMPNRDVTSKVKSMLELNRSSPNNKSPGSGGGGGNEKKVKKIVGRWDAVMSKISKNDDNKNNLKDVKSKVCTNVGGLLRQQETVRKVTTRLNNNQKSPNNKTRRLRTTTSSPKSSTTSKSLSSNHSSISDLSVNCIATKKGATTKRDAQVTQVLTPAKLSPRSQVQQNNIENKKNITPTTDLKTKRNVFPKEKANVPRKECGRSTVVKGNGTVPIQRTVVQNRTPITKQQPRITEGLAILVQHLVFNVGAYQVPQLRRQLEKYRIEIEEIQLACKRLEENLSNEKQKQNEFIENERKRSRNDITQLIEQHCNEITKLKNEHHDVEKKLIYDKQELENERKIFKTEFTKLQNVHQEALDILREENDAIREEIDEKNQQLNQIKHESIKLKHDYETREQNYKKQLNNLMEKMKDIEEENKRLRDENNRLLGYGDDKTVGIQEVQSLRAVLELKQTEVADLRRALAEATQKADSLTGAEEKATALLARCEDLQLQLQRKTEYEQLLISENQKLEMSFKEEINQKRRLSQYNEELQWKLKQNKEVMNKVLEQTHNDDSIFIRSCSSYNERHSATKQHLERTLSFRNNKSKTSFDFDVDDDLSPPNSPKVKIIAEKGDSVSYVLDLDESPDIQAQRIVRRSFRNSTTMPTKSPTNNKRARIRNPLSLSSSSSAILQSNNKLDSNNRTARSISLQSDDGDDYFINATSSTPNNKHGNNSKLNLDEEEDEDDDVIELPALPSEIGGNCKKLIVLPSPKHLAGEAMVSESNSEDESSTSSSQL